MKKKVFKIIGIVLAAILALALLVVCVFSIVDRVKHREFYKNAEKVCMIPGLWDGAVQQGFDYSEEHGTYMYSGYMKDGSASRIYIFDGKGNSRYVELKEEDGSDHTGHVGGVSFGGGYIYVTASSKNQILMFKTSDVLDGDGVATACDRFDVCVSPAYVYVRDNTLYTGEFYKAETVYDDTPETHWLETPAGEQHKSIMGVYLLGENGKPESSTPDCVISTRDQVQGMAFDGEGRIILSSSWGLTTSELSVYNVRDAKEGTITLDGKEIMVKYLDSEALVATITAPPMAEELVYRDGKLMIMNESASMKYIFGKITSGNNLHALDYYKVLSELD